MKRYRKRCIGLVLLAATTALVVGCASPRTSRDAALATRLDEILNRLSDTGATVTARVLELPDRRELYARDIDVPFTPASNMKIPVSAAGLDMFGLEHTFKTYLAIDGDDLWVIGTGDPGIGDPRLAKCRGSTTTGVLDDWADALGPNRDRKRAASSGPNRDRKRAASSGPNRDHKRAASSGPNRDRKRAASSGPNRDRKRAASSGPNRDRKRAASSGLKRIAGDLYYYDGALDNEWVHASWVSADLLHWYGAPVSGLNFNDNCVDITIYPTTEGQPVRYEVVPPVRNITVINECVTSEKHEPTIEKLPEGDIYKLGGTCAEQAELKSKPVGNPGAFFCDALRTHLASRGIVIDGETKRVTLPLGGSIPPAPDKLVAVHETSVRDIIGRINTNSQNFFAEAFCKLTGQACAARHGRHVPGSWADGDKAIRAFLRRCGIDDRYLVVADGSGLSDDDKLTTRLLTDLFAVMFSRPDGQAFIDSLAKGGVNGSLAKRFAGLEGHVFAKTGYIEGVRALSGYVNTCEGQWLTFSIIYNNIPHGVKPYEALQDEAVRLLIYWPNPEPSEPRP